MALPASQYSVLDAKRIDRIDDSTFRCYVDSLHFFGLVVEPVLTVAVSVGDKGPTVKLLGTRVSQSAVERWQPLDLRLLHDKFCLCSVSLSHSCYHRSMEPSGPDAIYDAVTYAGSPSGMCLQLEGSSAVQSANDHFDATMTNIVQWTASENGQKHISSDTSIQVPVENCIILRTG